MAITRRDFLRDSLMAAGVLAAGAALAEDRQPVAIVWSEGTAPKKLYPNDIDGAIADGLKTLQRWTVKIASLNDPDQGISDAALDAADVIIWWGHAKHASVKEDRANAVVDRVKAGKLGFIGTHSAHHSKPFKKMMADNCDWTGGYREDGSKVDIKVKAPGHPIAAGIRDFVIPHTERYSETFQAPAPADLVFDGLYTLPNGTTEPARQGMTWVVGKGRVFYFQPGHETYPIYSQEEVRQIFRNAVAWARPGQI
jgi:trehalose utilization protein